MNAMASCEARSSHSRILIVGAGFSGLAMARRFLLDGESDLVIIEQADEVGGTWRDNTYPGCGCDVPSHLYSYSFAPNPSWSRAFSLGEEIQSYIQGVATEQGLRPLVRFGCEMKSAAWDGDAGRWRLDTSHGELTADILVSAVGGLSTPAIPDIPGLDRFRGAVFHSARWDHSFALSGKRVAVIGTGASAIQVVPAIRPEVERLVVFQRTPPWIMPRKNRRISSLEHRLFRHFPILQQLVRSAFYWGREAYLLPLLRPWLSKFGARMARRHLERSVPDPALRERLTPGYAFGCKRILPSDEWYPALTASNVDLVASGIAEVGEDSITDRDGEEHRVDAIVMCTGFMATDTPLGDRVIGREGTLHEVWQGSPVAMNATTVAGFPNFFMFTGPNSGLGHTSILVMTEAQAEYIAAAVRATPPGMAIEPKPRAQQEWKEMIDRMSRKTVWIAGGCESWYLDSTGRNATIWPSFAHRFRRRLERFDLDHYEAVPTGRQESAAERVEA
jgi:cation diffusion facilitator CzcD-associated flavoprotein CzcO